LILFSYPLLVDEGRLSVGAEKLKEAHSQAAFVEANPVDAERLSLTAGSVVRVRTGAGEASLPVRVSDGVVVGAAFVPWNQPGLVANTLLSGSLVTEATLEPAAAEVTA
jgi:predicted molibdopterin-dependent oxidoreductase YjgC